MATAETRGTGSGPASAVVDQDLPALFARLGEDVLGLVDGKLDLLKLDVEEEAKRWARESLAVAMAAVVTAIGIALAAVGLAFALAYLLPQRLDPLLLRALAFGIVGGLAIAAGGTVLRRLAARATTPAPAMRGRP